MKVTIAAISLLMSTGLFADVDVDFLDKAIKDLKTEKKDLGAKGTELLALRINMNNDTVKLLHQTNKRLVAHSYYKCVTGLAQLDGATGVGVHSTNKRTDYSFGGTKNGKKGFYHYNSGNLCFVQYSKNMPSLSLIKNNGQSYLLSYKNSRVTYSVSYANDDSIVNEAQKNTKTCEPTDFTRHAEEQALSHIARNMKFVKPSKYKKLNEKQMLVLSNCKAIAKVSNNTSLLTATQRKLESIPGYQDLRKMQQKVNNPRSTASSTNSSNR